METPEQLSNLLKVNIPHTRMTLDDMVIIAYMVANVAIEEQNVEMWIESSETLLKR